jgi:hypothetical protein
MDFNKGEGRSRGRPSGSGRVRALTLKQLVGDRDQRLRHRQAKCLGGLQIDGEIKFRRLLYRQVGCFKCGSYPQRRGLVAYSAFAVSTRRAAFVGCGSSPNRHSTKKRPSSWRTSTSPTPRSWPACSANSTAAHMACVLVAYKVTTDRVGVHSDLLAEFPYLGPPHSARRLVEAPASRASTSPSTVAAISSNPRD